MKIFITTIIKAPPKLAQIIFTIAIFFNGLSLQAQNEEAVFETSKTTVVYVGLENPIKIAVPNTDPNDLIVRLIGKGTLTGTNGEYLLNPVEIRGRNRFVTLEVYKRTANGDSIFISKKHFRVFKVPCPKGYLGCKYNGQEITPTETKLIGFVSARLENFIYEGIRYKIKCYSIGIKKLDGKSIVFDVEGARVPYYVKKLLLSLNDGDQIIVDHIEAEAEGLGRLKLNPIELTVAVKKSPEE